MRQGESEKRAQAEFIRTATRIDEIAVGLASLRNVTGAV
jgi:hypothetical protein